MSLQTKMQLAFNWKEGNLNESICIIFIVLFIYIFKSIT